MIRQLLFSGLMAASLVACAHRPAPLGGAAGIEVIDATSLPPPFEAETVGAKPDYRIGAFDRLTIDVFGVENFAREVQVDGSGDIVLPLIGRVQAAGRSPFQLSEAIAQQLRGQYIRDPQVSVNLKETVSQVVTIDGQVREPGVYPVLGSMSLMSAVARASGTTEFAKLDDVVIFRTVKNQKYIALYNLGSIRRGTYQDPEIYAGDIVVVGDSPSRRLLRDLIGASSLIATPLVALVNQI
jgi:polysaccharide export outer membrane protein